MTFRPYLLISGVIFALVALVHMARVANGWSLQLGPWAIPMWASWCGVVVPATLSALGFRLAARSN